MQGSPEHIVQMGFASLGERNAIAAMEEEHVACRSDQGSNRLCPMRWGPIQQYDDAFCCFFC